MNAGGMLLRNGLKVVMGDTVHGHTLHLAQDFNFLLQALYELFRLS